MNVALDKSVLIWILSVSHELWIFLLNIVILSSVHHPVSLWMLNYAVILGCCLTAYSIIVLTVCNQYTRNEFRHTIVPPHSMIKISVKQEFEIGVKLYLTII